jgi:hypothetical protein
MDGQMIALAGLVSSFCHPDRKAGTTLGVLQHFLDRGISSENAAQTIVPERNHSKLDRLLFQGNRRRTLVNQFTDRVGNF